MNRKIIIESIVSITTDVFFRAFSELSSFIVDEALYVLDGRIKLFCAGIVARFISLLQCCSHGQLFYAVLGLWCALLTQNYLCMANLSI
jgi:hypothetical protein